MCAVCRVLCAAGHSGGGGRKTSGKKCPKYSRPTGTVHSSQRASNLHATRNWSSESKSLKSQQAQDITQLTQWQAL